MTHPFADYNKYQNQGVLVGNWVEEHALKTSTGTHRYEAWVAAEQESVYPKHLKASSMETFGRVFEHSDNLHSKDWITHNHSTHCHSQGNYREQALQGKRSTRMMKKALEEALQEPDKEPEKPNFETSQRATYKENDLKGLVIGARVMKTQDGKPVKRDHVFLAESKIVDRYRADKVRGREFNTGTPPDQAVTIYSTTTIK
ncbi:hypothetical protein HKI87_04g30990 [Chloropicon roscoffensis]|uniref:Uncharacterized protein n=1 Tax=Chloropicon roscoffensis TaxID=1461544 RepID=A0AAX4P718_9CHLO